VQPDVVEVPDAGRRDNCLSQGETAPP
jgi:hypothetical protein